MKVLITGATGFVGDHLIRFLITQEPEWEIIALFNHRSPIYHHPNISWQKVDLFDIFAVETIVKEIDYVFHCAALVSFDLKQGAKLIAQNIAITKNLVNACLEHDIKKFIHISSVAALGRNLDQKGVLITEENQWIPGKQNSNYAKSKYQSELEVWRGMEEGLKAIIISPSLILGENHWEHSSGKLIPIIYNEFPWFTKGINAWVDIKDVVNIAHLLCLSDISNERYIVCEGNYSFKEIFTEFAIAMDRKPPYKLARPWMTEILWRLKTFQARVTRTEPTITKETARTATSEYLYSNQKLLTDLQNFSYTPMKQTIQRISKQYLNQKKHNTHI